MDKKRLLGTLSTTKLFFDTSTDCLTDEDSNFSPKEGMFTVAQQIAHVAQTVEWFIDGAFNQKGFDLNFDEHFAKINKIKTVTEARNYLNESFTKAIEKIANSTAEELNKPIADGPILGGSPRDCVIGGIEEHTSHHRGALAVYSRLLGKEPKMPYA